MEPIALTLGQKFEIEKFSREIDNSDDLAALKSIAKELLVAWKQQQAASAWIVRQQAQAPEGGRQPTLHHHLAGR